MTSPSDAPGKLGKQGTETKLEAVIREKLEALHWRYLDMSSESLEEHQIKSILSAVLSVVQQELAAAELEGWLDCLRNVRGSLRDHPDLGGDTEVMAEVERICAKRNSEMFE